MHIWIGPPSSSEAVNANFTEVLRVATAPLLIVIVPFGGSPTGVTKMLTVAMLLSPLPSFAIKVKLSRPLKSASDDRSNSEPCTKGPMDRPGDHGKRQLIAVNVRRGQGV